jgi:hypothetical protein
MRSAYDVALRVRRRHLRAGARRRVQSARRSGAGAGGPLPSIAVADALLDERNTVGCRLRSGDGGTDLDVVGSLAVPVTGLPT